ncbi:hypothetical protein SA2016_4110 (plasmid) [Sinomonas atrocyanea]|uniref:Uncharacterized protein n=2 Tax=Sinomonas atrocyanea TaxID=37927 RepID=A0A127AAQ9_9MICC|nr:hypothetical protein SA2016_4110 [Sinomonas atrocyanea]GEB66237.1 hypothetical protein SAT01_36850 [Sinomonas atrocyanea]
MDRRRLLIVMSPQGLAAMDEASAEFDGIVGAALDEIGAAVGSGEFPALLEQLSGVLAVRLALDPACSDGVSAEAGPAGPAAEETVAGGMEDAVLAAPAAAGTEPPALDPCP